MPNPPVSPQPLLTSSEFERIFRTIHGVLLNEKGESSKACLLFSTFGAAILQRHFGISAVPVAGAAYYCLHDDGAVLALAEYLNTVSSSKSGFHCWIEADGWYVDFSAPRFSNMLRSLDRHERCGAKMFQKPLSSARETPFGMKTAGDFCIATNPPLIDELMKVFEDIPAYGDLRDICVNWFRRPPDLMTPSI